MLKHRKWARTGVVIKSLFLTFLLGVLGLVSGPQAIAGPTVIGVDGTTVNFPIDFLDGALEVNHEYYQKLPGYTVVEVDYPRSFGILTLGGPGYDKSVSIGKKETIKQIKKAQDGKTDVPVKVVCYSQGADACTQANDFLRNENYDQSSVSYLFLGNVNNADGGLKVRIPKIGKKGVFIPGPGVTLGRATATAASDAEIVSLYYEYDGFARAPEYPLNLLADINAMVGTLLYHGAYRRADPLSPKNIVSSTPDGGITSIMIPVDEVPLLTVARFFGLPKRVANVINPTLKAVVDTAYGPVPSGPGAYPETAVPFKLFPSKEKAAQNAISVRKGFAESKEKLSEYLQPRSLDPHLKKELPKPTIATPNANKEPPVRLDEPKEDVRLTGSNQSRNIPGSRNITGSSSRASVESPRSNQRRNFSDDRSPRRGQKAS